MVLDYECEGALAILTLNRPDVLNAFNDELGFALLEGLERALSDDSVRCVVITGTGRAFSSGEDLGALAGDYRAGNPPELGRILRDRYNPLVRAVRAAPKPVLAAVNGVAAGAGASLALACHYRIASEHASLVFAFIKVGLVPDSGALWFLTRMVGSARAWELVGSGRTVNATEAQELCLFDEVAGSDDFPAAWRRRATDLAAGPTRAYALTRALLDGVAQSSLTGQLEAEAHAQQEAGSTADHLEGVRAFLDKRPPRFNGA